jgi:membrane protein DedA with SNARE-associated domain
MADVFTIFSQFSYFGIFLLLFLANLAPILMPPTWLILASFHVLDESLSPLNLAIVGATGATVGRFLLLYASTFFRRFMTQERRSSLDKIADYLRSKRLGFLLTTFLFAATPLPSNMLFISYGLMKARTIQIYVGFWLGRLLSYFVMISISKVVLTPFTKLFEDRLVGIIVADLLGIAMLVLFASINWNVLISEKKLRFVKPKFWRL